MTGTPLKAVILDDYQGAALAAGDWSRIAPQVEVTALQEHLPSPEALAKAVGDATILIAIRERTPLRAEHFDRLPALKLVITFGLANASIDLAAASERGIVVCGADGAGEPTVEMTWALILAFFRNIPQETAAMRHGGRWQQTIGTGLQGKTIGLVGFGRVGQGVARVAAAFGMKPLAYTPNLTPERAAKAGAECAPDLDTLLDRSDIVSLHVRLNASTRHMVGERQLGRMKSGALLVNTSRGPVVDEKALLDALAAKRIGGAALDVFDIEPLPLDHPFRTMDNVLTTPHIGYVTRENYESNIADAIEGIACWLSGMPVRLLNG